MLRYEKERIAEMKPFRIIGVALLAVFALGAIAASVASAEMAPYFTIGGTRLVAGRTHNIEAHLYKTSVFEVAAGGVRIKCTGSKLTQGVLLGSNEGNPGKNNEIIEFSGCTLVEGNGKDEGCELEKPTVTTNGIISEQVGNVVDSENGGQLLELFRPANGALGLLALKFVPASECTFTEATVSGTTAAEVLKDEAAEGKIELGQTPTQATSYLDKFPTTAITQVWLISNGTGKIVKVVSIAIGNPALQTGTVLVLLANTKGEGEPAALWSGLP